MKKTLLISVAMLAAVGGTSLQARDGGDREKPAFSEIDANGDGQITPAELQTFRATRMADRFASVDANGDGSVSVEELVAKAREGAEDRAQRRAERMIDRMDANDNGTLEADEMTRGGDRAERGFSRADENDDGVLSQAEYDAMADRRGGRSK
ncbi:MAG: EF-hand domain-containing protein [Pseudomonadota bacterium]